MHIALFSGRKTLNSLRAFSSVANGTHMETLPFSILITLQRLSAVTSAPTA
ncbi:hypothetical protein D3C75_1218470 [compost metagenome]